MKRLGHIIDNVRRGSVLMEFIIVFPIYLVLMGGVFMVGDMLVKATRLASADRVLAFDIEGTGNRGWPFVVDGNTLKSNLSKVLFPNSQSGGDNEDLVLESNAKKLKRYANRDFEGPWSVAVATRTMDRYRLSPWTKGWLNFTIGFFDRSVHAPDMQSDDISRTLYGGNRYDVFAKDCTRRYSYYTLRRVRNYDSSDLNNRYRAMPKSLEDAGRLVDADVSGYPSWMKGVRDEPWPDVSADREIQRNSPPASLIPRVYERYGQFKTWSE